MVGRGIANPQEFIIINNNNLPSSLNDNNNNNKVYPRSPCDCLSNDDDHNDDNIISSSILSTFADYLKSQNKRNIRQLLCYAKRFGSIILESGDASLLLSLTPAVRRRAMEALTAYSKYTGTYQRWQEIRQAYLLKWTNGNESLASLQRFFNQQTSLDHMIQTVKGK